MRGGRPNCVVYVGNLPYDVREGEIGRLFDKYGYIRNIDVKTKGRNPAFAFIEFESRRDAEDAVRGRDGYRFGGDYLKVQMSRGAGSGPPPAPHGWRNKGTGFRIIVEDLPPSASWQDLKDLFRKSRTPAYTNVYSSERGVFGVVEYGSYRELREVMDDLRDAEFKNPFCDPTPVRLIDDTDDQDRVMMSPERDASPRGRSPVRGRSPAGRPRSPPSRDISPDARPRSRSRSPERSAGRRERSFDDRDRD